MDRREALETLGLDDGADPDAVRAAFRARISQSHPDVAGPDGVERTVRLNLAYAVLRGEGPAPTPPAPPPPPAASGGIALDETAETADATLRLEAPGPEAFALLTEAVARVGYISYIDRHLHLLEIVVRFEGGPSCSVVMSLQGRNDHTEIFVSMASIEAAPTPPIDAVAAALGEAVEEVAAGR